MLAGRAAEHERDVPFGLVVDALDDHVATLHPRRVEAIGPELAAVLPAAALYLSEKTIEHNPSPVYAKVGVRSHVELATRLAG